MHPRARELIDRLQLRPHPEGGFFAETHRSPLLVTPGDGRGSRSALTLIYFLLPEGAVSRWHRVLSDEIWHHGEGAPLELVTAPAEGGDSTVLTLGPLGNGSRPQHVVPAGDWQAARSLGAFTLVSCSVGPGFDFADFTLLSTLPEAERPVIEPPETLDRFL